MDYGYTTAGKFSAYLYEPIKTYVGTGWITIAADKDTHPSDSFGVLRLGGANSWTQAKFDNAKLAFVPEPGSLIALGTGLLGMLGIIRRRK
jgi:hypothetical protein